MTRTVDPPRVSDALSVRQGRVRASQAVVVSVEATREAVVAAQLTTLDARHLAGQYGAFIRGWTRGLVQTRHQDQELRLFLTAWGPCLLALALQDAAEDQGSPAQIQATLSIVGGLAAAGTAGDGVLVLRLGLRHGVPPTGVALEAAVVVEHYAPRLLALPLPGALGRLLYTMTQARLHRAITTAFVQDLVTRLIT